MPGPKKQTRKLWLLGALGMVLAGCGKVPAPQPGGETTIRIAHLTDYAWQDRKQTGQPVDFKPEAECEALYQSLLQPQADVLIVRGLGSKPAFEKLAKELATQGNTTWAPIYLSGPTRYEGVGFFLPQKPQEPPIQLSLQSYEVEGRTYAPLAGGVKTGNFWIWNAVWPEPSADYERRRNEARLLVQALRPLLQEGQEILLSLHSREDPDSPMFRMVQEIGLQQVIAADAQGDQWTHRDPEGIVYRQDQWLFATPELAKQLQGRILDTPHIRTAGKYRHQLLSWRP